MKPVHEKFGSDLSSCRAEQQFGGIWQHAQYRHSGIGAFVLKIENVRQA